MMAIRHPTHLLHSRSSSVYTTYSIDQHVGLRQTSNERWCPFITTVLLCSTTRPNTYATLTLGQLRRRRLHQLMERAGSVVSAEGNIKICQTVYVSRARMSNIKLQKQL